ncbi:MAG: prepilin peptidase [Candidatus Aenigmarchaeota archaeon]|nr:prepilin peptidase [Candidatus Aenigmarchaeota archaeon]
MLELALLAAGIIGFGLAAYLDLKTTEFPDYLPYSIIGFALAARTAFSFYTNDFQYIISGVMVGTGFLALGLALYYLKQWGDGDAWLLGALGFLFPDSAGFVYRSILPFPSALLFNFFFVAFAYVIVYSIALGFQQGVWGQFARKAKGEVRIAVLAFAGFSLLAFAAFHFGLLPAGMGLYLLAIPLLPAGLVLFIAYARFIEKSVFRKKVHVRKLRLGDVPAGSKWKVMTAQELAALRRRGGHVWVKEGVRFAPVFLITMLLTLFYGSVLF